MSRPLGSPALSDRISRFEADLRDAVWQLARSVLLKEYVRRAAAAPVARSRKAKPAARGAAAARRGRPPGRVPGRSPGRPTAAAVAAAQVEMELATAAPSVPALAPTAIVETAAPAVAAGNGGAAGKKSGRAAWTKDRVVEELGNWIIQDPVIDAATLSRRGQSALVAAARRLYGRFDAALNAANLHLADLYPDGPPSKRRAAA